jgi:hypothetical protein
MLPGGISDQGRQSCGPEDSAMTFAPARSRLVEQSVAPLGGEPVAPLGNRVPIQLQPVGDLDIAAAIGARQHDSGSQGQPGRTVTPSR